MDLTLVPYQHSPHQPHNNNSTTTNNNNVVKYKECMKNHAASIGGHANDGCREFLPRGPNDALTCAACGCHRNFHRKEGNTHHYEHFLLSPPPPPPPLHCGGGGLCSGKKHLITSHEHCDDDDYDHDRRSETPEREEVNVGGRAAAKNKRFRTKFTQEQKERMLEFAEKIGWRIQKHDDLAINQFCNEVGVKRNVLKVWMHNNKNAHRRARDAPPPPPSPSTVAQPVGV